ncbi:PE domain-containing protein [Mycobacterium malmoense]|uniref:PE domain-containing protein n=1 Tax=Mycobacterium malmoense TaxID=1780 RepID=UPI0011466D65|nr:PE domain-containing protein [Mycobacterium malmoense]
MPNATLHPFTAAWFAAQRAQSQAVSVHAAAIHEMLLNTLSMSSRCYPAIEAATTAADS